MPNETLGESFTVKPSQSLKQSEIKI